jgi:hypothetical protein
MFDWVDGQILSGQLNDLKARFSKRYAKCVRLIREFDQIAHGKPIPFNLLSDYKEGTEFWRKKVRLFLADGEIIVTHDPSKDPAALAIVRLNGRLEKYRAHPVVDFALKGERKGSWIVNWESATYEGDIACLIVRLVHGTQYNPRYTAGRVFSSGCFAGSASLPMQFRASGSTEQLIGTAGELPFRFWRLLKRMAGTTRLELATSAVTG